MVINETLTELTAIRLKLLTIVSRKIAVSRTSNLNAEMDNRLRVDINEITQLFDSFESRLRESESIYYTYLRNADHDTLCSNRAVFPIVLNVQLSYGTSILKTDIVINERFLYKEIIDAQFRHFILLMASQYEVIVRLAEILIRKIVLHTPDQRPSSTTLSNYIILLKSLVGLRYRKHDDLYNCIDSNDPFLSQYLPTVTYLRNIYIHGYSVNLESDGVTYNINKCKPPLSLNSPLLNIVDFSSAVMTGSRSFFLEMLDALEKSIRHPARFIPA